MSLEVSELRVRRGGELALDGVAFELEPGTLTALVGPNGAGKSTLLQAIEGQLPIESGSIRLDGVPLTLALARQQLALMPQRGEIAWHFPISVRELVALGRMAAKRPGCCDVEAALQRVGLAGLAGRRLDQLSVASSSEPCWPAPWCSQPGCCCSMSPALPSTPLHAPSCSR